MAEAAFAGLLQRRLAELTERLNRWREGGEFGGKKGRRGSGICPDTVLLVAAKSGWPLPRQARLSHPVVSFPLGVEQAGYEGWKSVFSSRGALFGMSWIGTPVVSVEQLNCRWCD